MSKENKIRTVIWVLIAFFVASFSSLILADLPTRYKILSFVALSFLALVILFLDGELKNIKAKKESEIKQKELNDFLSKSLRPLLGRHEAKEKEIETKSSNQLLNEILNTKTKSPINIEKNNIEASSKGNVVSLHDARLRRILQNGKAKK